LTEELGPQPGAQLVAAEPETILPQLAAKLPWFYHVILIERVKDRTDRLWYMQQAVANGWSRSVLSAQIKASHREARDARRGDPAELLRRCAPRNDRGLAVDAKPCHQDDQLTIGLLLCQENNRITVEYALRDVKKPIGVAQWRTRLVDSLPKNLRGALPTVEQIERELAEG
jgi:hypothetical protein